MHSSSTSLSEADLDEALAKAFATNPEFAAWFLKQTPFKNDEALYSWGRSDNPWSRVLLAIPYADAPDALPRRHECETDILVVYEATDGRRLALHIENKLANGSFTPNQPELYRARKEQWKRRPKLGNYTDAATVLVAPQGFYDRNIERAKVFDSYISHEDIAKHLPSFSGSSPNGA